MLRIAFVFSLMVFASSPAFAESLVVIASTNAGKLLQAGTVVETGKVLNLPDGASATLLSQNGQIVKLTGPHSSPLSLSGEGSGKAAPKEWSSTLSGIADVVSKRVVRSNVIGSSRETDTALKLSEPDIWVLTVDSSGNRCLKQDNSNLWRKDATMNLKIDLRSKAAREKGMVWQTGAHQMPLPNKFVKDGTLVVMKIDAQPRRFNIHVLPAEIGPNQWGDVMHWMVKKECSRQASLLAEGLHNGQINLR